MPSLHSYALPSSRKYVKFYERLRRGGRDITNRVWREDSSGVFRMWLCIVLYFILHNYDHAHCHIRIGKYNFPRSFSLFCSEHHPSQVSSSPTYNDLYVFTTLSHPLGDGLGFRGLSAEMNCQEVSPVWHHPPPASIRRWGHFVSWPHYWTWLIYALCSLTNHTFLSYLSRLSQ